MKREEWEGIIKQIRDAIFLSMDFSKETTDEEVFALIDTQLTRMLRDKCVSVAARKKLRNEVFHSIRKLDVLQALVDDAGVTEIMINGPDHIFIERCGYLTRHEARFATKEKLEDVIQQIVASCNRVVNESSPIVDARLANGARVNIVLPPVAINGPIITIRRFPDKPIDVARLIGYGALTPFLASYLEILVRAGMNIFIAGGTGAGKTTFLNAMSGYIPRDERIITVEDNAELQILHLENLVKLEARNANVEGCVPITIRDLIKSALRMRPDRIVVGEVRGAEAIDMIQAMNTGHDGSMSTGHANSARDMLARLETMILMGMELPLAAIRSQLASAIDIIVHLGRLRDRSRKLLEICEVTGRTDRETGEVELKTLFRFTETGETAEGKITGEWRKVHELENMAKIRAAGLMLPAEESGDSDVYPVLRSDVSVRETVL